MTKRQERSFGVLAACMSLAAAVAGVGSDSLVVGAIWWVASCTWAWVSAAALSGRDRTKARGGELTWLASAYGIRRRWYERIPVVGDAMLRSRCVRFLRGSCR